MAIQFRKATLADVDQIVSLVNTAYRGDSGKIGWTTEAGLLAGIRTDAERISQTINLKNQVILVAEEEGKIEGCVHLTMKNETTAYLGMLTVNVHRQAAGLGRRLLQESERFVRTVWEMKTVEMTVITVRKELIEWYQRRGYTVTNERRPFPRDEKFGIPLQGELEFVVLEKQLS